MTVGWDPFVIPLPYNPVSWKQTRQESPVRSMTMEILRGDSLPNAHGAKFWIKVLLHS